MKRFDLGVAHLHLAAVQAQVYYQLYTPRSHVSKFLCFSLKLSSNNFTRPSPIPTIFM